MQAQPEPVEVFARAIEDHLAVVTGLGAQQPLLELVARRMVAALEAGNKILWCGNGGSAADAQHLAAEIVGRFRRERRGLASVALTVDSSVLTSVSNDYGFEQVFSRQVEALGVAGDVLVGISTSGNSANVLRALEAGRKQGLVTVAFTGEGGGRAAAMVDHLLAIGSRETARIQEAHILAGHMLCDWIELAWVGRDSTGGGAR